MKIDRIRSLSTQVFLDTYLAPGQPVIVADAMEDWPARSLWTPDYLNGLLGNMEVQVYDELFGLLDVTTLSAYLQGHFNQPGGAPGAYIRWYSQLKDVDFAWADKAFACLADDWRTPYFLPLDGYTIPYVPVPCQLSAESARFPYRGLFISGKGARTRLHRDPWTTSAVLCQFYGDKQVRMFHPDQTQFLMNGGEFVDLGAPDLDKFPNCRLAKPSYEDVLGPGEVLFIPGGWLHEVTSLEDSISVTWNFVHDARRAQLCSYLHAHPYDSELDVLRYFLTDWVGPRASTQDILSFLETDNAEFLI